MPNLSCYNPAMHYKLGWIGTAAFQVMDGPKELVFDLAEGQTLPPEFKEGDGIDIVLHPDHPANIAMGMNSGYYEVTHLESGTKIKLAHKTSEWRFDKKLTCEPCDLRVEKNGENYIYKKPGVVVPTKLENYHVLRQAYETRICPLCGCAMNELS